MFLFDILKNIDMENVSYLYLSHHVSCWRNWNFFSLKKDVAIVNPHTPYNPGIIFFMYTYSSPKKQKSSSLVMPDHVERKCFFCGSFFIIRLELVLSWILMSYWRTSNSFRLIMPYNVERKMFLLWILMHFYNARFGFSWILMPKNSILSD